MTVALVYNLVAQESSDNNAIKFFLSPKSIYALNSTLPANMPNRLYMKMSQLVNQTGIAEIGYSTFLISPKLDILSASSSNAGVQRIFLAECELTILVQRTSRSEVSGEAVFNSMSKRITGSGDTKDEAIANALNSLSVRDKEIVEFLTNTKVKIKEYFKVHCKDVLTEAQRARSLKNYEESIALFFSVPTDAPCHNDAVALSEGVFNDYIEDQCETKLISLKGYVALAQNNSSYYDSAMSELNAMSPYSPKCLLEAKSIINKIESRLGEEQKRQYEEMKKERSENADLKKEMYKAMGRISSNYQPNPSTNVIITPH
jgi:hypothetical protein